MLEFPKWIPSNIHGYFLFFDVDSKDSRLSFRTDHVPVQLLQRRPRNRLFWGGVTNKIEEKDYLFFIKCVEDSYRIANEKPRKKADIEYYKALKKTLDKLIPLLKDKRLRDSSSFDFDQYIQSVALKNIVFSGGSIANNSPHSLENKIRETDYKKRLEDTIFNIGQLNFMIDLELIKISNKENLVYSNLSAPTIFCKSLYFEIEDFIDDPVTLITHALNIVFINKKSSGWDTSYVSNIIRKSNDF